MLQLQRKLCTDQIAALRIIIEQCRVEHYIVPNFIDFQMAFDSVDRGTIWKLLDHYGVPDLYIKLIQQLYDNAGCQVIHKGKLTDTFTIQTGVRQGCMLSPMIFLNVVDWFMRQTTMNSNTGIKWNLTEFLEDLDFADDLCLKSQSNSKVLFKEPEPFGY